MKNVTSVIKLDTMVKVVAFWFLSKNTPTKDWPAPIVTKKDINAAFMVVGLEKIGY